MAPQTTLNVTGNAEVKSHSIWLELLLNIPVLQKVNLFYVFHNKQWQFSPHMMKFFVPHSVVGL